MSACVRAVCMLAGMCCVQSYVTCVSVHVVHLYTCSCPATSVGLTHVCIQLFPNRHSHISNPSPPLSSLLLPPLHQEGDIIIKCHETGDYAKVTFSPYSSVGRKYKELHGTGAYVCWSVSRTYVCVYVRHPFGFLCLFADSV